MLKGLYLDVLMIRAKLKSLEEHTVIVNKSVRGECTLMTVEPQDHSFQDNVDVVHGSYFAVVDQESPQVCSDVMYTVGTTDGQIGLVKRKYLRHWKWYHIVFLQVTNDKKHD